MSPARGGSRSRAANGASAVADEPFHVLVDHRPPSVRGGAAHHGPAAAAAPAPPAGPPRVRVIETPPGPDGRPRAPRREVEVDVPGYAGFTCWVWANYPQRLREDVQAEDEARLRAVLARLVVGHNGWCDADGEPFPPADDPAFYDAIPLELAVLLVRAIVEAPGIYPNSLSATSGR